MRIPERWMRLASPGCLLIGISTVWLTDDALAFQLTSSAVSGGAVAEAGGGFALAATIAEAGVVGQTAGGSYRLIQGFWRPLVSSPVSVEPETEMLPRVNALGPASLNPFRGATAFDVAVAAPGRVRLSIFDVSGRRVAKLVDRAYAAGHYRVAWSGRDDAGRPAASGIYYVQLEIGTWSGRTSVIRTR